MRIAAVCSEVAPFSKTGGLGDVAGAGPAALRAVGEDVAVITPLYAAVRENCARLGLPLKQAGAAALRVVVGSKTIEARIFESRLPNSDVPVFLLENASYYGRPGLYGDPKDGTDYPDNAERFIFLARGALEACQQLGIRPDVFECNDWQTALLPVYVRHIYRQEFPNAACVMTVHNLAYQGLFERDTMNLTGLPWELFNWQMLEYYGRLSFLKGGLVAADAITTVSKTYAQEIQTKEFGMGLEGVLRERSHVLVGIVNGVDYSVWNPETDELIAANYSADDLADKAKCKKALQKRFKLPMKKDVPLLGMIGRLIAQKGFDMVAQAAERLMDKGLQIVLLGTGQKEYHEWFTAIAHRFPRRFGLLLGFDEALAHQIEAGSDMFLMPSRFEPCGLNQIYSLKYGTVPIVSRTGGLADTITDCGSQAAGGSAATGFCFDSGDAEKMLAAVDRALDLYRKAPEAWRALQLNGMRQDWSWERSARQYVEVYRKALQSAGKR